MLHQTDESALLSGLGGQACAEPGSAPGTFKLWAEGIAPQETSDPAYAMTALPSLPMQMAQRDARWVDDRGNVLLGEVKTIAIRNLVLSLYPDRDFEVPVGSKDSTGRNCNSTPLKVPVSRHPLTDRTCELTLFRRESAS